MTGKLKCLYLFLVAIVVVMASFVYFKDKQMISADDSPEIRLISVDYKKEGKYGTLDLSKDEISKDLNASLVSIFENVRIRNKLLPAIESHTVLDGDTYITIKVDLKNSSLFLNLQNDTQYSSVQLNNKKYHIVNSESVYEEVYSLLFDQLTMEN